MDDANTHPERTIQGGSLAAPTRGPSHMAGNLGRRLAREAAQASDAEAARVLAPISYLAKAAWCSPAVTPRSKWT